MTRNRGNRPPRKCTSKKQLYMIRKTYAERAAKENARDNNGLIPVRIKTHNDSKGGHPHIILDNVDDKHVSVGITHQSKKGKNSTNYALEHNPLGENKPSYMRRQGTVAPKNEYAGSRQGSMTPKDYAKAKEYGEKAKNKYLDKKDKDKDPDDGGEK